MLQTRPSSTGAVMTTSQSHGNHQYAMGSSQAPRSAYNTGGSAAYRAGGVSLQPYGFTSTPNLGQSLSWQQYGGAFRTNSTPAVPSAQTFEAGMNYRPAMSSSVSANNLGYSTSFGVSYGGSRDDSALTPSRKVISTASRPQSYLSVSTQPSFSASTKQNGPNQFRRPGVTQPPQHGRSQSTLLSPSPAMASPSQMYQSNRRYSGTHLTANPGMVAVASMDDLQQYKKTAQEDAKRMRRRSLHAIEASDFTNRRPISRDGANTKPTRVVQQNAHSRNGSSESVASTHSNHSRTSSVSPRSFLSSDPLSVFASLFTLLTRVDLQATNRNASVPTGNPSLPANDDKTAKNEQQKMLHVPSRGPSSDGGVKRTLSPSPLSKPVPMEGHEDPASPAAGAATLMNSPAAKQLAALNQKGTKSKSKTSRLRRAFSFGSAAELRSAAGVAEKSDQSKLHKEPTADEAYDAEQARIAEAQEAGGIGNNIYGGRFFGSTDNLSISSTASSASIMIRKMGRGMKKSTRSLVGLFRPKSVIGVPAAEAPVPEASQAAVSMITVEAETQRVNADAESNTTEVTTGVPRFDPNLGNAADGPDNVERQGSPAGDSTATRRSIVGGEKERAEVLAAVKKGILKSK